jgi:exosortase
VHLPNFSLYVAEACSGVRSLVSLITVGTLFAYFKNKVLWQRLLVIAASLPVTIVVNILRVSNTGFLAYYFGRKATGTFYHELSGIILFLMAAALFFGLSSLLSRISSR